MAYNLDNVNPETGGSANRQNVREQTKPRCGKKESTVSAETL